MSDAKIQEYVDSNKNKFSRESIEKQLLEIGASKEKIDKAFAGKLVSDSKSNRKFSITIILIAIFLFSAAVFAHIYFSKDSLANEGEAIFETDENTIINAEDQAQEEGEDSDSREISDEDSEELFGEPVYDFDEIDSPEDRDLADKLQSCEPFKGVDNINRVAYETEIVGFEGENCRFKQESSIANDAILDCLLSPSLREEMVLFIKNSSYRIDGDSPVDIGIGDNSCKIPGYID